jgi:cyclopropane fatty-acyl-phospholipid synthase-like methyltransferase
LSGSVYDNGRHYDAMFGQDRSEERAFYRKWILEFGQPALEIGCGSGQLTVPLAQSGLDIEGLDMAPSMLESARQRATEAGLDLTLIEGDCRTFARPGRYGTVFFPANSIAHLTTNADLEMCLARVRESLRPEGGFLIHAFHPSLEFLTRDPQQRYPVSSYADPDSGLPVTVTETSHYDGASQVNHIRWRWECDGHEWEKDLSLRMLFPQELDALLRCSGFEIVGKFGRFDETPFESGSPSQLVVCRVA